MPKHNHTRVFRAIRDTFGKDNVVNEWDVASDSTDTFTRELYSPRVDIAVGPFNKTPGANDTIQRKIAETRRQHIRFIERLSSMDDGRRPNSGRNPNPRCFLAIEFENKTTKKHRLGSILNACALGSIGIGVGCTDEAYRSLMRIRKYLEYLRQVGKSSLISDNLLLIREEDFLAGLNRHL